MSFTSDPYSLSVAHRKFSRPVPAIYLSMRSQRVGMPEIKSSCSLSSLRQHLGSHFPPSASQVAHHPIFLLVGVSAQAATFCERSLQPIQGSCRSIEETDDFDYDPL